MIEVWTDAPPPLYAVSREGILALLVDDREAQVQPSGLYGNYLRAAVTDSKGVLLAAAGRNELWVTADGGKTWNPATGYGAGEPRVLAGDGQHLFVGSSPAAIYRSDDGGKSWRSLGGFIGPWGEDWRPHGEDDRTRVSAIVARGTRVIAAVCEGGVMVSESSGDAFRKASDGLPPSVLSLALAPRSDEDVLAGTTRGLYRTTKLGTSNWRHVHTPPDRAAVTAVAVHPTELDQMAIGASRALYLAKPGVPAGADAGIYLSRDGGETFRAASLDRVRVVRGVITSIVFVPRNPEHLFVGTSAGELFESRDRGVSFSLAAASLPGIQQLLAGPAFY